ncbi:protein shisa-5-like [Haliotis rubra]|uniref:protein shisa-5-like n=1 Tax=Haliotis rubra TaxID=36100 RepID=UPI001EE6252F|nr:protein shisa-5-like [Haliotis rubra]
MTSRRLLDFHDDYIERTSTTMSGVIGIIVGIIVLVIIVIIIVCFCVCRRRRGYTGRTLYSPAPQAHTTTTTTTSYPANHTILYPAQQPMPQQPMPQQPVNYQHYPAHPPPGQAPPPYPGPPHTGYHSGPPPYPMATGDQQWQPSQQKMDSAGYTGGMDQSYLQKASAPPPEPY